MTRASYEYDSWMAPRSELVIMSAQNDTPLPSHMLTVSLQLALTEWQNSPWRPRDNDDESDYMITFSTSSTCPSSILRVHTEIWLWFSRKKLRLFPDFSRHFVHLYVNKDITKLAFKCWNFVYNVFFYSIYQMWLKFFLLWTSDALCYELQEY